MRFCKQSLSEDNHGLGVYLNEWGNVDPTWYTKLKECGRLCKGWNVGRTDLQLQSNQKRR